MAQQRYQKSADAQCSSAPDFKVSDKDPAFKETL